MANRRMKMGKPKVPKTSMPSPKAVYKERMKKPEPDNFPAKPKGAKKRLMGRSI